MLKIKQLPEGPYNPVASETEVLANWLAKNYYSPEKSQQILHEQGRLNGPVTPEQQFCLINPPPNAYARPHMGNVSGYAYQDLFGRRARMQGKVTLLFPGKDHAAQQAEVVYIRDVLSKQGKSKADYTRDEFVNEAYEYFSKIAQIARQDEQRIGLSADFSRDLFTLDPRVYPTIYGTFEKMWKDNLVYKGVRIINWSPGLQSAVADIDTERETVTAKLCYYKYPLPHVDQDILEIRQIFTEGTFKATVEEVISQKNKIWQLKLKFSELEKPIITWLSTVKNTEVTTGMEIELDIRGLVIPLATYVQLVAEQKTSDTEKVPTINTPEIYNYIFKEVNKLVGSAFIRLFADDDNQIANDYARAFVVATVRPETIFGDTALAVNPKDERYAKFVGEEVEVKGLNGPVKLKIITDQGIEQDFGTGLLKVTPAHSATDYDIYLKHNASHPEFTIGYKNVIGKDGKLNELAGICKGLHAEDDRDKIINIMSEHGLIVFSEPTVSNVTICERTKTIIQPMMSSQWFIDTDKLKVPALEAIRAGKVKIHPDNMTKKLESWLEHLRDWPISRSIWWGYRIPVWYKGEVAEYTDDQGQIAVEIGGVKVKDMADAITKGLMKLDLSQYFTPILIPGRYALGCGGYFAELKQKFPWAAIVDTGTQDQSYQDYEQEFSKLKFTTDSVVVAHSLGAPAIIYYLLKNKININKLILLSPSNPASENLELFKQHGFWADYENYPQIKNQVEELVVIYSNNDENYQEKDLVAFADYLGAKKILEPDKQHFVTLKYSHGSAELEKILTKADNEYSVKHTPTITEQTQSDWIQDTDVFDTWFSSGQWPVATLKAAGLMKFYPTSVLETGFDILELWVSRMIMLGLYLESDVPFRDVYLHGLIKAEDGQKMSKSKGNIVYTEDIIGEFGADTLRMFYIVGNKAGASYRMNVEKIKGYRNFLNKIWNVSRFVLTNLGNELTDENWSEVQKIYTELPKYLATLKGRNQNNDQFLDFKAHRSTAKVQLAELIRQEHEKFTTTNPEATLTYLDASYLLSLDELINNTNEHLNNFRPGMAAEEIIQHFWHVFADIYIEQVKPRLFLFDRDKNPINRDEKSSNSRNLAIAVLTWSLTNYLKLLHPFIPFITENIWQFLPTELRESETIMYSNWPEAIKE